MEEPTFPTLAEAIREGRIDLNCHHPSFADEMIVAWTTPDKALRTRVNLVVFGNALESYGYRVLILVDNEDDGSVARAHLLVESNVPVVMLCDARETIDAGEHLSQEAYDELADKTVQAHWAAASQDERMDLVIEGGDPIDASLEERVPEGAALSLYRGLE